MKTLLAFICLWLVFLGLSIFLAWRSWSTRFSFLTWLTWLTVTALWPFAARPLLAFGLVALLLTILMLGVFLLAFGWLIVFGLTVVGSSLSGRFLLLFLLVETRDAFSCKQVYGLLWLFHLSVLFQ